MEFNFTDRKSSTLTDTNKSRIGRWFAEFLGTCFLVLFVKLSAGASSQLSAQYGIGFGLLVLVYQYGYLSGGQFNPCVAIGLLCRGSLEDFPITDCQNTAMYITSQMLGGIAGGLISWGLTNDHECSAVYPFVGAHFASGEQFQAGQAFGAEFLFTFLLVFVIINVATAQQPNSFYGLCIGWTLFVSIGCIGEISGACLNIAVWIGAIISASACSDDIKHIQWKYAWVYLLADVLGGICAGLVYRFLFIRRKLREKTFQKLLTEGMGTFLLVCIVKLASYATNTDENSGYLSKAGAVETIGTGLIVLVYLFGYIGGAHFNPSVSLGVFLTNPTSFTWIDFSSYFAVQVIGGFLGGLFAYGIGGTSVGQIRVDYNHDLFSTSQAFFAELVFTFNLVNTVLHVTTSAVKENNFYGLAIGSSLGTAVACVGINGISGACLNFAVWFGTTASSLIAGTKWDDLQFEHIWIYLVAPFGGSVIAAAIYRYLYSDFDLDSELEYAGERTKHQIRRYCAEFLGTAYLVCIIKLVSASYTNIIEPDISAAVGVGFGLICLVYQWGYISQAHFNPAITLAVYLHGDIEGFEAEHGFIPIAMYMVVQVLGGFAGGLMAWGIGGDNAGLIYPDIIHSREDYQVFGAEFVFTFLLVALTVINNNDVGKEKKTEKNHNGAIPRMYTGISVGWMVMATIDAIGALDAVSGCCLNPAVWLGTILSAACATSDLSGIKFEYAWVYLVSELLAGVAAGLFIRFLWKDPERRSTELSKYVAEFFGTFYLVAFIKLVQSNEYRAEHYSDEPVLAIGFGLCVLVYCFGPISGAHYNPAVSLGVYCKGYVEGFYPRQYMNVLGYISAQMIGGLLGGMFAWGVTGKSECNSVYLHVSTGSITITGKNEKAFFAELLFTFLLVSSVIHAGVVKQPNDYFGMTIGFSVFVAVQLIGGISGACLNPAVWFGTIVSAAMCVDGHETTLKWGQIWIYLLPTLIGGVLAGFLYRFLFYEPAAPRAINEPELVTQQNSNAGRNQYNRLDDYEWSKD